MQYAYLLHARAYKETSQLLDFLTHDAGRIQLIAKGVKGNKRKQSLQLFTLYSIDFQGRSELKTLTHYESVKGYLLSSKVEDASEGNVTDFSTIMFPTNILSGKALYCGFYINELFTRLLPKSEAVPEIFQLYQNTLQALLKSENMTLIEFVLRRFEFKLLDLLGYGYDFLFDRIQNPILAEKNYYFIAEEGFAELSNISSLTDELIFSGADILQMSAQQFELPSVQRAAKRFIRLALIPYLGDKPLKSRELFINQ